MKKILKINRNVQAHWVGDGFPVQTLMSYPQDGKHISPFLLLDYAGPAEFQASPFQKGVGFHPHRGFETVTIVYQGEIEHRDNAGHSGKIGPGDVQWMTAARGVLHEEKHGQNFSNNGGTLEMVQLWVNLPAKAKMSQPHYQEILSQTIPTVKLDDHGNLLRVIAGQYGMTVGVAKTITPINVWDMQLTSGSEIHLNLPSGYNTILLVLRGKLCVNHAEHIHAKELIIFETEHEDLVLKAMEDSKLLVLNGEPINEPIVGQGPFVMNTKQEIVQAFEDYRLGRF